MVQLILILMGLSLCPPAYSETNAETNPADITGTYFCYGADPVSNTQYSAQVTVTKDGEIFRQEGAEEGVDNAINTFLGTVIFAKDAKDTFATIFWQKNDINKTGLIISQIQPDGSWQGIWKWKDRNEINIQICKKKLESLPQ